MAIIKYSTKKDVISVFEDPNPGKNTIYLEGEGYIKDSMAYKHNSHMFMTPGGDRINYRGTNIHLKTSPLLAAVPGNTSVLAPVTRSGLFAGMTMALTKDVGYAGHTTLGNNNSAATVLIDKENMDAQTNLVVINYLNMIEGLQRGAINRVISNDFSTISVMWYLDGGYVGPLTVILWPSSGVTPEMYTVPPSILSSGSIIQPSSLTDLIQEAYWGIPTEEDGQSGWVSELCIVSSGKKSAAESRGGRGTQSFYGTSEFGKGIRPTFGLKRINLRTGERSGPKQAFNTAGQPTTTPGVLFDEMVGQYIGRDNNNTPNYFFNDVRSDHVGIVVPHIAGSSNSLTATGSELILNSITPETTGIRFAFGRRDTTGALGEFAKFSSKIFYNSTNNKIRHWFTPFFDKNSNYYPFLYSWDLTIGSNSFTRVNVEITLNNGNSAPANSTEGLSNSFGQSIFTGKSGPSFTGNIRGRYRHRRALVGGIPTPTTTFIKNNEDANNGLADIMYNEQHSTYENLGTNSFVTANSNIVTGSGTLFQSQLVNGDVIKIDNIVKTVNNIVSDTELTVTEAFSNPISSATSIHKLNRYLTMYTMSGVFNKFGSGAIGSSTQGGRVVFTYKVGIDSSTIPPLPKKLTYHSSFAVPSTIKSVVFLKDDRSLVGMILQNSIVIYQWNDSEGWVSTTEIPGIFTSLGRDATDRIWATEAPGDKNYVNIHSLSISIPVRIVLTTLQNNYDYDNTPINSQIFVSAYNFLNQRIDNLSVSLSIIGTSTKFVTNNVELQQVTVTTSSIGDIAQDIRILSAGISEIIASISI
jgi:hypothetical protein